MFQKGMEWVSRKGRNDRKGVPPRWGYDCVVVYYLSKRPDQTFDATSSRKRWRPPGPAYAGSSAPLPSGLVFVPLDSGLLGPPASND
jgi:hypothetical protein